MQPATAGKPASLEVHLQVYLLPAFFTYVHNEVTANPLCWVLIDSPGEEGGRDGDGDGAKRQAHATRER